MKLFNKIKIGVTALLLSAISLKAQETTNKKPLLEINGFARNYTGVLFQNGDLSILQNTLDLTLKHRRKNISFLANPFYYHYSSQDDYFDFRELYMDVYSKKVDLRIGKQQIVWGQADGVFITDIVSPLNLTDFLLWDFNEIRQGVTAVKMKYYPNEDHNVEVVLMPSFTPAILPKTGSIWRNQSDFPVPPTFDSTKVKVPLNVENSELFVRYSISKSAVDLQFIGGYTWDDVASLHVKKQFSPGVGLTGITITPEHHRLWIGGANISTSLGNYVVRGEGAYYNGKYFQTKDPKDTDALVKKDYLNYVVGLDRTLGNWKLSGQFIQKAILNHEVTMSDEQLDNLMTIMVNRTLMREKLRLELFSYIGLNNEDALLRLRGYYFPMDGLSVELGTNLFLGDKGQFGQYHDNSMIYTRIKYSF